MALQLNVSALFRFVSDDLLGVGGAWRRDAKTSNFGTISIRK